MGCGTPTLRAGYWTQEGAWSLSQITLERAGLIFLFLAFWLGSPEILGRDRLQAIERYIRGRLNKAEVRLKTPPVKQTVEFTLFPLERMLAAILAIMVGVVLLAGGFAALLWFGLWEWRESQKDLWSWRSFASTFARQLIELLVMVPMLTGIALVLYGVNRLFLFLVRGLIKWFADHGKYRVRALILGAVAFHVGLAMQFAATIAHSCD